MPDKTECCENEKIKDKFKEIKVQFWGVQNSNELNERIYQFIFFFLPRKWECDWQKWQNKNRSLSESSVI